MEEAIWTKTRFNFFPLGSVWRETFYILDFGNKIDRLWNYFMFFSSQYGGRHSIFKILAVNLKNKKISVNMEGDGGEERQLLVDRWAGSKQENHYHHQHQNHRHRHCQFLLQYHPTGLEMTQTGEQGVKITSSTSLSSTLPISSSISSIFTWKDSN